MDNLDGAGFGEALAVEKGPRELSGSEIKVLESLMAKSGLMGRIEKLMAALAKERGEKELVEAALQSVLMSERNGNEYVHLEGCSGDRRHLWGEKGCGCPIGRGRRDATIYRKHYADIAAKYGKLKEDFGDEG